MEIIVKGSALTGEWEKRVQATDVDDAIGSLVGWGYVSNVYRVSDDGGKTERSVRWDQAQWRSVPTEQGT